VIALAEIPTSRGVSPSQQAIYARPVWAALRKVFAFGYPPQQIFSDWLELALAAHLSVTDNFGRKGARPCRLDGPYESRYRNIITRYPEPRAGAALVAAYDKLTEAVRLHKTDVLGPLYRLAFPKSGAARVGTLKASVPARTSRKRFFQCPCHSGEMLVNAGKRYPKAELHGSDADEVRAKMCALNMAVFGFTAVVKHADVLAGRIYRCWRMVAGFVGETDFREGSLASFSLNENH
jgi:hypothetical protein